MARPLFNWAHSFSFVRAHCGKRHRLKTSVVHTKGERRHAVQETFAPNTVVDSEASEHRIAVAVYDNHRDVAERDRVLATSPFHLLLLSVAGTERPRGRIGCKRAQ